MLPKKRGVFVIFVIFVIVVFVLSTWRWPVLCSRSMTTMLVAKEGGEGLSHVA